MIEVADLVVDYEGRRALGPLTASLGRVTLVAGAAQSGKTTLLKALCGLVPRSGTVRLFGEALPRSGDALAAARARLGMVFQSDALFDSLDALENVALPLRRRRVAPQEAEARAAEALFRVGLAGQERTLPERLSGGMRKRVGIARAVAARPDCLLADDPVAGLDPGTTEKVVDLLFDLFGEKGLVIAAADPAPFARRCAEVLVLREGMLAALGPADRVRQGGPAAWLFEGLS
jgi:phospholipid/cholesterol/gamma-HCH transport system ATP-binding protein